jgi:hypothetical protein
MCMSCGCKEPNERHKPGDIVQDDLAKAAKNANIDMQTAADNIQAAAKHLKASGGSKSGTSGRSAN